MSKSEKIDKFIDMGFEFDDVVKKSESSPAYVKGRFTKKGLDWRVAELPEMEVEEKREEGSEPEEETSETVGTEDATEVSGDLVELPVPSLDDIPEVKEISEELKEIFDKAMSYKEGLDKLPTVRRARSGKYINTILTILENADFSPRVQNAMNCRYSMVTPRPTRMNFYKELFHIQNDMKELFKNYRK